MRRGGAMDILEELYGLEPLGKDFPSSARKDKLSSLVTMNDSRLLAELTDEQKTQFEKCRDAANELSDLLQREAFATGFILAVQIMTSVINSMKIPSVDE